MWNSVLKCLCPTWCCDKPDVYVPEVPVVQMLPPDTQLSDSYPISAPIPRRVSNLKLVDQEIYVESEPSAEPEEVTADQEFITEIAGTTSAANTESFEVPRVATPVEPEVPRVATPAVMEPPSPRPTLAVIVTSPSPTIASDVDDFIEAEDLRSASITLTDDDYEHV